MDMGLGTLGSVEQYLNTCYDPDVEYVDGVLVERTVGDWLRRLIQSNVIFFLRTRYRRLKVVPEPRSQTTPTRFRSPDVTVLAAAPGTKYLLEAAFITIEVVSEDDRMTAVMEKLDEYATKGVPNIWLIDPRLEQIFVYRSGALSLAQEAAVTTTNGEVELRREEIFQR